MARKPKKDDILAAAEKLFIAKGFSAVSMDDIASAAPVSKPTLYAHFEDKADLFLAVFEARCRAFTEEMKSALDAEEPPETALPRIAALYLDKIFSDDALSMVRVVVSVSAEFPGIGERFYKSGPRGMETLLADYLAAQHRKRRLRVSDPTAAAEMFMGLLKGNRHIRVLLGIRQRMKRKDLHDAVRYAVDIFLAGHAL